MWRRGAQPGPHIPHATRIPRTLGSRVCGIRPHATPVHADERSLWRYRRRRANGVVSSRDGRSLGWLPITWATGPLSARPPVQCIDNAAFKEAMGDLRQYRFPNEVSWVVAAVTADLDECVYLRVPPDMTLTKPTDPGWLGLIFQGHVKLNAERWDHRIFAVESLLPESHEQSWVADTEVTFLAIPVPVAQHILEELAAYAADTSDMLRTIVHGQLESIIQVQSHDQAMEDGARQSPTYVTRPAVAGLEEEELKQTEPALGSYLVQLRRLQRGMRSYLTSRPERKVTNCHHGILKSTG